MLAIAATAFAGVQGFAPVANPSARVMAMQVRRFPIGCFGWLIECSLQNEKNGNAGSVGYRDTMASASLLHVWSCHVMLVGFLIHGREHMRSNDAIGYRQLNLANVKKNSRKIRFNSYGSRIYFVPIHLLYRPVLYSPSLSSLKILSQHIMCYPRPVSVAVMMIFQNTAIQMAAAVDVDTKAALATAANEARGLAMDSIAAANSGHMGLPLGAAEIGASLYGSQVRLVFVLCALSNV